MGRGQHGLATTIIGFVLNCGLAFSVSSHVIYLVMVSKYKEIWSMDDAIHIFVFASHSFLSNSLYILFPHSSSWHKDAYVEIKNAECTYGNKEIHKYIPTLRDAKYLCSFDQSCIGVEEEFRDGGSYDFKLCYNVFESSIESPNHVVHKKQEISGRDIINVHFLSCIHI